MAMHFQCSLHVFHDRMQAFLIDSDSKTVLVQYDTGPTMSRSYTMAMGGRLLVVLRETADNQG
jgi:6-phosphogluconolactonase (cycloisomerase 2 family)